MSEPRVLPCTCSNKAHSQDEIYGRGRRLHNAAFKKGAKLNNYKCTVCGKENTSR